MTVDVVKIGVRKVDGLDIGKKVVYKKEGERAEA